MIDALTAFFGSVTGIITGLTALFAAVGVAFDQWRKARLARVEAARIESAQAAQIAKEKTKFEDHLLQQLERERQVASEALAVERAYSKSLLEKLGVADSHVVDCNERLRALEDGGRRKDETLAVQGKIIERMDQQVQTLLKGTLSG